MTQISGSLPGASLSQVLTPYNAPHPPCPQDIKAASLRTLTSIVHLERTPKLSSIIDCTGTASYHGFLPVLVRTCIQAMIGMWGASWVPLLGGRGGGGLGVCTPGLASH